MAIFTMSDLHLSLGTDKPMEVFGRTWDNYVNRIYNNWSSVVSDSDTVLIGGDVSWAMSLAECKEDFDFINSLPGHKLIFKGNHDYWWESITKMNNFLEQNGFLTISFMHNNAVICEDSVIMGTRGWSLPGDSGFGEEDAKIYRRELLRLELSLKTGSKLCAEENFVPKRRICVFHYPPFTKDHIADEGITSLLWRYGVTDCFYGHLHASGAYNAFEGNAENINYTLTSADHLGFMPIRI